MRSVAGAALALEREFEALVASWQEEEVQIAAQAQIAQEQEQEEQEEHTYASATTTYEPMDNVAMEVPVVAGAVMRLANGLAGACSRIAANIAPKSELSVTSSRTRGAAETSDGQSAPATPWDSDSSSESSDTSLLDSFPTAAEKRQSSGTEEARKLRDERDLWMLIAALEGDRLDTAVEQNDRNVAGNAGTGNADVAFTESGEIYVPVDVLLEGGQNLSDVTVRESVLRANAPLRRAWLVQRWLETTADLHSNEGQTLHLENQVPGKVTWRSAQLQGSQQHNHQRDEATLLGRASSNRPTNRTRTTPAVTKAGGTVWLDPDAPLRQTCDEDFEGSALYSGISLPDSDAADELLVLRATWNRVRQGHTDEAEKILRRCGQHWRAASLFQGAALFHDQFDDPYAELPLDNVDFTTIQKGVRGDARALHQKACFELIDVLSKQISNSYLVSSNGAPSAWDQAALFERALYAVQTHTLAAILPLIKLLISNEFGSNQPWRDVVWACLKTHIDAEVDKALLRDDFAHPLSANFSSNFDKVGGIVFSNVQWPTVFEHADRLSMCGSDLFVRIARFLIQDRIPQVLLTLVDCVHQSDSQDSQHLRFAAHLFIFFARVRPSLFLDGLQEEASSLRYAYSSVMEGYCRILIQQHSFEGLDVRERLDARALVASAIKPAGEAGRLVARYCALLSESQRVPTFTTFFVSVPTDPRTPGTKEMSQSIRIAVLKGAEDFGLDTRDIAQRASSVRIESGLDGLHRSIDQAVAGVACDPAQWFFECSSGLGFLMCRESDRSELVIQTNHVLRNYLTEVHRLLPVGVYADVNFLHSVISILLKHFAPHVATIVASVTPILAGGSSAGAEVVHEYKCWTYFLEVLELFAQFDRDSKNLLDREFGQILPVILEKILRLPGGFMLDADPHRVAVRRFVIPLCTFICAHVCVFSHHYRDVTKLADIIAAEMDSSGTPMRLYAEFETADLQDFLRLASDSSLELISNTGGGDVLSDVS